MISVPPVLELRQVVKSFGTHRVLDNVDLTIGRGEVHGLLGENGSGKSTLIKILSGTYAPEAGRLFVSGTELPLPLQPGRSRSVGMEFVHQDLGLIPTLSVAENLLLTDLASGSIRGTAAGWFLPMRALVERARAILAQYEVGVDPQSIVSSITPVERALVAIVRAVHGLRTTAGEDSGGLLVLDEPTVFLPRHDVDRLFSLVRQIVRRGGCVLFVSHDIDEVLEITDAVTVLRDGRVAGTRGTRDATKSGLIELIIGRQLRAVSPAADAAKHDDFATGASTGRNEPDAGATGGVARERTVTRGGAPVLQVEAADGAVVRNATFGLERGEVLGLTGLMGSGFDELPYLIYGARDAAGGMLTVNARRLPFGAITPRAALKMGVVLIPADRRRDGSALSLTLTDNVTMPTLRRFRRNGMLRRRRMTAHSRRLMDRFDVRPREPSQLYRFFSGGNQQKALLAKWLQLDPQVLLLHEPTQGVDVGAREQVFAMIRDATRAGAAVLCASSDYEQLSTICNRVLIFSGGRIVAELHGPEVTKTGITKACYDSFEVMQ